MQNSLMKYETYFFGLATGIACVATIQYFVHLISCDRKKHLDAAIPVSPGVASVLASLDSQLMVSSSKLQKIVLHMVREFKKGLASDQEIFKMIPSYVVNRPTGNEVGTYLALDLGGTNFRVCRVNLEGYGNIRMSHAKFTVSEDLKTGSGTKLFDFFADCVANFCKDQGLDSSTSQIPMGFTFSFPVNQTAIDRGINI